MYILNDHTEIEDSILYKYLLQQVKRNRKGLGKLFGNRIKKQEALETTYIILQRIELKELNFLKYFPNVEELHFMDCRINTLEGIACLNKLETLTFSESWVGDYSAMAQCPQIEIYEYMVEENIEYKREKFEELAYLPKLWQLDLSGNYIRDLGFLSKNPSLKEVVLDHNPIQDLSPLQRLSELNYLEISSCGLKTLEGLESCKGIKTLYATDNELTSEQKDHYRNTLAHINRIEI